MTDYAITERNPRIIRMEWSSLLVLSHLQLAMRIIYPGNIQTNKERVFNKCLMKRCEQEDACGC